MNINNRFFSFRSYLFLFFPMVAVTIISGENKAIESSNQFGLRLFGQLISETSNTFLSPFSIYTALGMVYAGANGSTASQMKSVMLIKQKTGEFHKNMKEALSQLNAAQATYGFQLNCANALWMEKTYRFLPSYIEQIKTNYFSGLMYLDFFNDSKGSVQMINNWVKEKTNSKIPQILDYLSIDVKLVVTNAIYFHAGWKNTFSVADTKDKPFFRSLGDSVLVPMMNKKMDKMSYYENGSLQLVKIPYKGDAVEMVVLLPKKGENPARLERSANYYKLQQWMDSASASDVILSLPKFKINFGFDLRRELQLLGLKEPFLKGSADFSLMDGSKRLSIDQALHSAFINVDEKGTEAAAATVVSIVYEHMEMELPPKIFNADHPFLFIIRDTKFNNYLFIGRLVNPKEG